MCSVKASTHRPQQQLSLNLQSLPAPEVCTNSSACHGQHLHNTQQLSLLCLQSVLALAAHSSSTDCCCPQSLPAPTATAQPVDIFVWCQHVQDTITFQPVVFGQRQHLQCNSQPLLVSAPAAHSNRSACSCAQPWPAPAGHSNSHPAVAFIQGQPLQGTTTLQPIEFCSASAFRTQLHLKVPCKAGSNADVLTRLAAMTLGETICRQCIALCIPSRLVEAHC